MSVHGGGWHVLDGVERCFYCGSMTVAEATRRLRTPGANFSGCDNKYGFPHKFYLDGPDGEHGKFYTAHLNDASDADLAAFAALSRRALGVDVARDDAGRLTFLSPRLASGYGWQTWGRIGEDGAPEHAQGAPVPPPEAFYRPAPQPPSGDPPAMPLPTSVHSVLSVDEQLAAVCPFWSAADWAAFRSLPPETQALEAAALAYAAAPPPTDWAHVALSVLVGIGEAALAVVPGASSVLRVVQALAGAAEKRV